MAQKTKTTLPLDTALAATQEQFEKATAAGAKNYDEFAAMGRDNIEAFVKAGTIVAKGVEKINETWLAFAKANMESGVAATRDLFKCTNVQEVFDLQAGFAKTWFDSFVSEGTKISEIGMNVANDAAGPLQAQVAVAVEKVAKQKSA